MPYDYMVNTIRLYINIISPICSQYGDMDAESQNFLPSNIEGKKKYEVEYVSALISYTIGPKVCRHLIITLKSVPSPHGYHKF